VILSSKPFQFFSFSFCDLVVRIEEFSFWKKKTKKKTVTFVAM